MFELELTSDDVRAVATHYLAVGPAPIDDVKFNEVLTAADFLLAGNSRSSLMLGYAQRTIAGITRPENKYFADMRKMIIDFLNQTDNNHTELVVVSGPELNAQSFAMIVDSARFSPTPAKKATVHHDHRQTVREGHHASGTVRRHRSESG